MAGVMNPGQRQGGALETVMKGLSIARDVYGIRTDMAQLDQMEASEKRRIELEAETKKEKERVARGEMKTGEYQKLLLDGKNKEVAEGTPGAIRVPVIGQDGTVFDKYVAKAEAPTALKAPTSRTRPDGVMEEWDPQKGWFVVARKPETPKNPKDEAFDALPKAQQNIVTNLGTDVAKKLAATSLLDQQLGQFRAAYESGDEAKATMIGGNMVKLLNSDQGADAVGAEESKRLAADLEYQIANFFGKGETWGRNLPRFFDTAAGKSNAMKAAARANEKIIEDIYAGKFAVPADIDTRLVEGGDGTALADTTKTTKPPPALKIGHVEDGYEFTGGDPGDQKNWKKVAK